MGTTREACGFGVGRQPWGFNTHITMISLYYLIVIFESGRGVAVTCSSLRWMGGSGCDLVHINPGYRIEPYVSILAGLQESPS